MSNPVSNDLDEELVCHVCRLHLSRKQRLISHLKSIHPDVPLPDHLANGRSRYKWYEVDNCYPIPRRTQSRWRNEPTAYENSIGDNLEIEEANEHEDTNENQIQVDETVDEICPPELQELSACSSELDTCQSLGELLANHDKRKSDVSSAVLAFVHKMKLTDTAAENLVKLMRLASPDDGILKDMTLRGIKSTNNDLIKCVDFCGTCKQLFLDEMTNTCATPNCSGLRFSGSVNDQHLRKKKHFFATIPLSDQLVEMTDRLQVKPTSLTFNTDGVPLYNSSSVSLWPVFLVVNDLPPPLRFATQNIILWGLWQGTGKPVFRTYLKPMVDELNMIYKYGLDSSLGKIHPRLTVGTMDLQAKAYVMEMTQHNGSYGCLACEETGQSCQQGKGRSRGYPYREEAPPLRTTESIVENATRALASSEKFVKGIKSASILLDLEYFHPAECLVPDYMHGVLLGTTKKLLCMWFDRGHKEPYSIGKFVKEVDSRLGAIKPTDDIPRLPRQLDGTYHHWKASELQNWLLFYAVPCLNGILPKPYFDNLCLLVNGIYLLLGDALSDIELDVAGKDLLAFYQGFETLYGTKNTGLNVHNIGLHLAAYAKKHGPLWAWSCFPFEDLNGWLLRSAHGTGNVCQQLLGMLHGLKNLKQDAANIADEELKVFTQDMLTSGKRIKTLTEESNCMVAGKPVPVLNAEANITQVCGEHLQEVKRVHVHGQMFYSDSYTRIEKRKCSIVLFDYENNQCVGTVEKFYLNQRSGICYAKLHELKVVGLLVPSISHIVRVERTGTFIIVPVDNIVEKVLFFDVIQQKCIARLPNLYRQCR